MNVDLIVFLGLAVVAVATGLGMLLSRNAVYSALFLVLNFATVAVFYLLLGAPFIAMAQITVYAGAIMVLFLFVIMLLGAEQLAPGKALPRQKYLAAFLAFVLVAETVYLLAFRGVPAGNVVAMAFKRLPPLDFGVLYERAFEISKVTDLPARQWVNGLKLTQPG